MSKYSNGEFIPLNPEKYRGKTPIRYRSSWEHTVMQKFDQHPNVLFWGSETLRIPYHNPFTKRNSIYIPDFIVRYIDKTGKQWTELIEVKPSHETNINEASSRRSRMSVELNIQKWTAAQAWCKRNGIRFRVLTEQNIYGGK